MAMNKLMKSTRARMPSRHTATNGSLIGDVARTILLLLLGCWKSMVSLAVLLSELYAAQYRLVKPWPDYNPFSLIYTYHRFKSRRINHYFFLVPSIDVHIVCDPSNFTRSLRGLPYPKLDVFIQSCLDTYDMLQLCDVIDGTNVSEEWGKKNLDLEGTNDIEWTKDKNKRGREFGRKWAHCPFARQGQKSKQEMWESLVRTKVDRLDWTKPKDIFINTSPCYRRAGPLDRAF
ncbi:hypothetical protein AJ80_03421 [Polytolypa hystricis UAMH7299]|uniref:Uncharacterized protein n=1 Tax=Polytolypa hystricis (strain UAMH7299) TaxID=1447883 RepID=A0A2B7Y9Q1_POLH7|nr:hypothetical protein AJ80_03421 [Polytolypa hystricis UAMH7299]